MEDEMLQQEEIMANLGTSDEARSHGQLAAGGGGGAGSGGGGGRRQQWGSVRAFVCVCSCLRVCGVIVCVHAHACVVRTGGMGELGRDSVAGVCVKAR